MLRRSVSGSTSLNTTSTHDSKRSEDARCRLAALSEVPSRWSALVERLRGSTAPLAERAFGAGGLPPQVESSLCQAAVAIWPTAGGWDGSYTERVVDYCMKAAREAKVHTAWSDPDHEFERALTEFIHGVLASTASIQALGDIVEEIGPAGAVNSLALVVLKAAAPGVPDFYQGTETWRNLLVDPDNRRPVDYPRLRSTVSALPQPDQTVAHELVSRWGDGSIKAFVIRGALRARRDSPQLFAEGRYLPVEVRGRHCDHVVAFIRQLGDQCALAVVPRLTIGVSAKSFPLGEVWTDTQIRLTAGVAPKFRDVFTGTVFDCGLTIPVSQILASLPVALLLSA